MESSQAHSGPTWGSRIYQEGGALGEQLPRYGCWGGQAGDTEGWLVLCESLSCLLGVYKCMWEGSERDVLKKVKMDLAPSFGQYKVYGVRHTRLVFLCSKPERCN